jgi:hypothetical protein
MRVTRIVIGVVSCVMFFLIMLQSCAVGIGNSLSNSNDAGGAAGVIVAFLVIVGGILSIIFRDNTKSAKTAGYFYAIAGVLGMTNSKVYSDLGIWGFLCICAAIFFFYSAKKEEKLQKGEQMDIMGSLGNLASHLSGNQTTTPQSGNSSPMPQREPQQPSQTQTASSVEEKKAEAEPASAPQQPVKTVNTPESDASPSAKPKTRFCRYCGAKLAEGAVFCGSCGKRVN